MRTYSRRTQWISIFLIGVIILALSAYVLKAQRLQESIASGGFESTYTSAIHTLQMQTTEISKKMEDNRPGDTKILSKEHLKTIREKQNPSLPQKTAQPIDPFGFTLTGIYLHDINSLAEINGKLYEKGDQIGEFTVNKISSYHVVLNNTDGTEKELRLTHHDDLKGGTAQ